MEAGGAEVGGLAADDLRDALVAHVQDLGDRLHRQVVLVGAADCLVALASELVLLSIELGLAALVVLGEGFEGGLGLGCLSFRASDWKIVR